MQSKPWYASKTIWGALIATVAAVANGFAPDLVSGEESARLVEALAHAGEGIGLLLVIVGRVTAKKRIGKEK